MIIKQQVYYKNYIKTLPETREGQVSLVKCRKDHIIITYKLKEAKPKVVCFEIINKNSFLNTRRLYWD